MKKITNTEVIEDIEADGELLEVQTKPSSNKSLDRVHDVKINTNRLVKLAEDCQIPIFVAYYDPHKGYQYDGVLPEEVKTEDVQGEYGRFIEFMRICINFNAEDQVPKVCKKTPMRQNDNQDDSDIL